MNVSAEVSASLPHMSLHIRVILKLLPQAFSSGFYLSLLPCSMFLPFFAVQIPVSFVDQFLNAHAFFPVGTAYGNLKSDGIGMIFSRISHRILNLYHQIDDIFLFCQAGDHDKFITAVTCDDRSLFQMIGDFFQRCCRLTECLVTLQMTIGIIDLLESVKSKFVCKLIFS